MPTDRDLARMAYAAYGESTGGKNFRGEPMPAWEDLPAAITTAWVAAVAAVRRQFGIIEAI